MKSGVLALLYLLMVSVAAAQTPGTFSLTGNLLTGRYGHRAVRLADGKVLVVGGNDNNKNALASAELYDPATGSSSSTGGLSTARRDFALVMLADARVLVVGGYDSSWASLASAEIYDPPTGSFSVTGSMSVGRAGPTATRLSDRTVLVAGGWDSAMNGFLSAEIYDPSTGLFTSTGSMNFARGYATAVALQNGSVLVAGGMNAGSGVGGVVLQSAEVYGPASSTFVLTGNLNVPRVLHTATLLNDGRVLFAGGEDPTNILGSAELYDPVAGVFNFTGDLNVPRGDHSATLLGDGRVLVAGGFAFFSGSVIDLYNGAEIFDPGTSAFVNTVGLMNAPRQVHSATLLQDGTVLVAGGFGGDYNPGLSSAEVYQPLTPGSAVLESVTVTPAKSVVELGRSARLVAVGFYMDHTTERVRASWQSQSSNFELLGRGNLKFVAVMGKQLGTGTVQACVGQICGSSVVTVVPRRHHKHAQ